MLRIVLTLPIWGLLFLISQVFGGTRTKLGAVTLNLGLLVMGCGDLLEMMTKGPKR